MPALTLSCGENVNKVKAHLPATFGVQSLIAFCLMYLEKNVSMYVRQLVVSTLVILLVFQ